MFVHEIVASTIGIIKRRGAPMKHNQDWDSMKHTAFSYSFTPKEFYFFLFKKPKCPKCGEKLIRKKEFFSTKGKIPGTFTMELASVKDDKVKYYYYTYTCPRCGEKYTISELANSW